MKVNFDGLRLSTARSFNDFADELEIFVEDKPNHPETIDLINKLDALRGDLWIFMCLQKEGEYNHLSDKVKLKRIELL